MLSLSAQTLIVKMHARFRTHTHHTPHTTHTTRHTRTHARINTHTYARTHTYIHARTVSQSRITVSFISSPTSEVGFTPRSLTAINNSSRQDLHAPAGWAPMLCDHLYGRCPPLARDDNIRQRTRLYIYIYTHAQYKWPRRSTGVTYNLLLHARVNIGNRRVRVVYTLHTKCIEKRHLHINVTIVFEDSE